MPQTTGAPSAGSQIAGFALVLLLVALASREVQSEPPRQLDPAAWGSDHVGQKVPDYVTGDQCLFCHRTIGPTWGANRHNLTIRELPETAPARTALEPSLAKELAAEIQFVIGDRRRQRFLKASKAYGQLELLSMAWAPPQGSEPGKLIAPDRPQWDANQFAESCAGCHATAVESQTKAFSSLSLDCYVCHGHVPTEHPNQPELAYLSPSRKDSARVVTSICAQCHVRTGRSRSTGRPYPTHFVAGDNLFRDFKVDFSEPALGRLDAGDRHVLENVRAVAVLGDETLTCLSCHDVHGRSSARHRQLPRSDYCLNCHGTAGPPWDLKPYSNHSQVCGY